jgi:aspartokinase
LRTWPQIRWRDGSPRGRKRKKSQAPPRLTSPESPSHLTHVTDTLNCCIEQILLTTNIHRISISLFGTAKNTHATIMSGITNGHRSEVERIANHTEEKHLPGGWVVLKFGGTSVGKFAENIAGIVK